MRENEQPEKEAKPAGTTLLQWSDEMSVGNEALDDDHKAFFDFAKILAEVEVGRQDKLVYLSAINMLEDYVTGHFHREEKALRAINYPHLEAHVQKHNVFRQHVYAIINDYRGGKEGAIANLPTLIVGWLDQHILREDMQYKYWIKDKFVDKRPLAFLAVEAETGG